MKSNSQRGLTLQDGLYAFVIVAIIGLLLGFFAIFNDKFVDVIPASKDDSRVNESLLTVVNETGAFVVSSTQCNFESFTVNECNNNTNGKVIAPANYTTSSEGKVIFVSSTDDSDNYNNTLWNCSYSYSYTGNSCNISRSMNTEFQNQTDILGLVLLAVFFGIAITALLASFLVRYLQQSRV